MLSLDAIYHDYRIRTARMNIKPASLETYCRTVYDEKDGFILQTDYCSAAQLAGYRSRGANSSRKLLTGIDKLSKNVSKRRK